MSTTTVNAPTTTEAIEATLKRLAAELRESAYFRFEERQRDSDAFDDWLEAERRLVVRPAFGIEERGLDVRITSTEVPEFMASELRVEALPHALFIFGCHEDQDPSRRKRLAAQVKLPCKVKPNTVRAELRHGHVEVRAKKAILPEHAWEREQKAAA